MQDEEIKRNIKYGLVQQWQVAPKTFEDTDLKAHELHLHQKLNKKNSGSVTQTQGASSNAFMHQLGTKSINSIDKRMLSGSMPRFANSPSGGTFSQSDRRWKSPTQVRDS